MKNLANYPLIGPLLEQLEAHGISLTEKSLQSLNLASYDAKQYEYRQLYDDSVFSGVIRAHGAVTGLFQSLGLDPLDVIEQVHSPLPQGEEYRKTYSKTRDVSKKKRRHHRPLRQFGTHHDPPLRPYLLASDDDREHYNGTIFAGLQGTVTSKDLFLRAMAMPAVWRSLHRSGLSINKVRRYAEQIAIIEPDIEVQKFTLTLEQGRISLDLFDLATTVKIEIHNSYGSVQEVPCRVNIITPKQHELAPEIEEFEWLINGSNVAEYDIQKFLEKHPRFLLGIEYKSLHSQLTLVREDKPDLRPDFFLERADGSLCDILDVKLPDAKLVVGRQNRRTFSAAVMSALGQLGEYRRYFDDTSNRNKFNAAYGLKAYRPKVQVLIGRSSGFRDFEEREALKEALSHLQILTFDDILGRVRQQYKVMA